MQLNEIKLVIAQALDITSMKKKLYSQRQKMSMYSVRVLNVTFRNISVMSLWSALLVEETGVPGENHRPVGSH
jgi:hypothetical protein